MIKSNYYSKVKQRASLLSIMFILAMVAFMIGVIGVKIDITAAPLNKPSNSIIALDKDAIKIENNKHLPEKGYFDKEVAERVGVLVKSTDSDAEFGINGEISGMFEMAFRVYSSTTTLRDVSEFYITFSDIESSRSFTIMMDSKANFTEVMSSIYVDNESTKRFSFTNSGKNASGIAYADDVFRDNDGVNRRPVDNISAGGRGLYTSTSFSNNVYTSEDSRPYSMLPAMVNFDPQTMEVKILTQDNWYRIIDLDNAEQMSNTKKGVMSGFNKYNVTMRMTLAAPGAINRDGKVLIYSINGQQLIPATTSPIVSGFKNTAGPAISAKPSTKWLKGQSYKINAPLAYDVISGNVTYTANATITDPDGANVTYSNNEFTPLKQGDYTITFPINGAKDTNDMPASANNYYAGRYRHFVKNSDGEIIPGKDYNYGSNQDPDKAQHADANPQYLPFGKKGSDGNIAYKLTVIETQPQKPQIEVNGIEETTELAPNTEFTIPAADATNPMGLTKVDRLSVSASVTLAGAPVFSFDKMDKEKKVTFVNTGIYTITYSATDVTGNTGTKTFTVDVSANYPTFIVQDYSSTLARGEVFVTPVVTAKVQNTDVAVSSTIILPDGKELTEDGFRANIVGQYKVKYTCETGGKTFYHHITINVNSTPSSLFKAGEGATITQNVSGPEYAARWDNKTKFNGVKITASGASSTISFQNPINLADNTKEQSLFEYLVTPELERDDNGNIIYAYEFTTLSFTLTDVYDKTNYVTIKVKACTNRDAEYIGLVQASAKNNVPGGLGWDDRTFSTASYGGTNTTTSFHGKPITREGVKDSFVHSGRIYFDYSTKEVFVDHTMGICGTAEEAIPLTRVIDFDDTKIVGAGNEWSGFTTGEVYVSITASELVKKSASYMMLGIDGIPLGGENIVSGKPPVFQIDKAMQSSNPEGEKNVAYPIFNAKATDVVDGILSIGTEVYFDYKGQNELKMPLSADKSTFTPDKAGDYTIVYSSGINIHTETIKVKDTLEQLDYIFDTVPNKSGFVGKMITIPYGRASGGSGDNKKITLNVIHSLSGKTENISTKNNIFTPVSQGIYSVTVTAQDYLGKKTIKTYDIAVTYDPSPIITKMPSIPKTLQKGKKYIFPNFEAIDYASNKACPMDAKKQILIDGIALPDSREYIASGEKIKVTYRASAVFIANAKTELSYDIDIVDYNNVELSKYFYAYGGDIAYQTNEYYASYTTQSNNSGLQFANSLFADNLSLSFAIPAASANYEKLGIILTDSENANIKVTMYVQKFAEDTYLYVNGKRAGKLVGAFGNENQKFSISYNNNSFKLFNSAGVETGKIALSDNGEEFVGFTSKKLYLDLVFSGVETGKQAGIQISQLNGQMFTNILGDGLEPSIIIESDIAHIANIGNIISIPFAIASDVLDPEVSVLITVRTPSNDTIIDEKPLIKGESFEANEYGNYVVIYTIMDSVGNRRDFPYTVSVPDKISPIITIDGNIPTKGKVNKTIKLPSAKVTDNYDSNLSVYVFILNPNGEMQIVENNKYKPTQAGEYTVYYYAQDSGYSYTYRVYTITVA